MRRSLFFVLGTPVVFQELAHSDALAQYGAVAHVEKNIDSGAGDDPTSTASHVSTRNRPYAFETLDRLLLEVPGTQAQRSGGYGSFVGLSLRGANLEHTTYLLGEIPLSSSDGGLVDLSTLPIELFERVEVFRGGAPFWLGAGGIGGVVRLVPRTHEGNMVEGSLSAGSFGFLSAQGGASVVGKRGSPSWTVAGGVRHSDGDFSYRYDNGTPLISTDDSIRTRQNGHVNDGFGLGHFQTRLFRGELHAVVMGFGRTGGLTGTPIEEPTKTRRSFARLLSGVNYEKSFVHGARDLGGRWQLATSATLEQSRITDLYREIALIPRATNDQSFSTFSRGALELELSRGFTLSSIASYRWERYAPQNSLSTERNVSSYRNTVSGGIEAKIHGRVAGLSSELRASGRVDFSSATLHEIRDERLNQPTSARIVAPTGRLGVAVQVARPLAISASVATSKRLPSMTELFGDRGYLLGDSRLKAENSVSIDLGGVLRGQYRSLHGSAELHGYGLFVHDLIRYVRTSQFQLVPQNVARATLWGSEFGVRGGFKSIFSLAGSLSWLHTRDHEEERELPLRPRWRSYVRPEIRLHRIGPINQLVIYGDVTYVGANFVDPRNQVIISARTLFGAGVSLDVLCGRARIEFSVRDLGNARAPDLVGFPLPGRSFFANLTFREGEEIRCD